MMSFVKELFSDDFKKIKTPETLSIIIILLLIFKFISVEQYNLLINGILQELGELKVVTQILQLVAVMYLILSVIVSLAAVIFTIGYIIADTLMDCLKNQHKYNNLYNTIVNKIDVIHRFFIGSKIAVLKVNSWFLVVAGYLYLFDEEKLMKYYKIILNYFSSNIFIFIFAAIYFIIIVFSILHLTQKIIYKLCFVY